MEEVQRIRKEVTKSTLVVARVYPHAFNNKKMTAELKQTVTTKSFYPSTQISNNLSGNIFTTADFGFTDTEHTNSSIRVSWIDVPLGSTVESVTAKLAEYPQATLYTLMGNRPFITDAQDYSIKSPEIDLTLDHIANQQVIRGRKDNSEELEIKLDSRTGKIQYRMVGFSAVAKEDIDVRDSDPTNTYSTPEIDAELAVPTVNEESVVITGQSL